ncbi:MAG TPA: substrate binding domain-containing protein, partial [Acetobacteraceae bacterium]|nr:substrate binding domain-containing protein [Acetobacteraceae bacterium]
EAGQEFYESALRVIDDLDAAVSRIGRGQTAPHGLIRVTIAPVFGRLYLVPRLHEFFLHFPDITVDFVVTERTANLVEEGIDLAIHNGELNDSSLVARRIATTPIVTVADESYLAAHGEPAMPSDLERHRCVLFAPSGAPKAWGFKGKFGPIEVRPNGSFRTNDADQIRAAVLSGLGLAHAPGWLFAPEIASGAVRVVLRDYEPTPLPISAVHPSGRRVATKVRVFIDFLAEILPPELGHHPTRTTMAADCSSAPRSAPARRAAASTPATAASPAPSP